MNPEKLGPSGIRRYWKENARRYGTSYKASWTDLPMIEMEICQIGRRLADDDRVLDIGCANGYSTLRLASHKDIRIKGVDFIPDMIGSARRLLRRSPKMSKKVEFQVGNITALREKSDVYDKVTAVRVFINFSSQGERRKALQECARVLKPGGRLILSDAMLEGWKRLNQFRKEWDLAAIPMPAFNSYLKEKELLRLASAHFRLVESVDYSSTYFVGTRVLKPLLQRTLQQEKDPADALAHWNHWFSGLPSWGNYGVQKLFVFEKP